jgi:predicted transcriptional regulator
MNLNISDRYLDSELFLNFIGTPAAVKIYTYLLKYLVISKVEWTVGNVNLYNEYFKKGYLVSRYTQEDLGLFLNLSQSTISKNIKKLEQMNFIKTFKINTEKGKCNIYVFGEIENGKFLLYMRQSLERSKNASQIVNMINRISDFKI